MFSGTDFYDGWWLVRDYMETRSENFWIITSEMGILINHWDVMGIPLVEETTYFVWSLF